ncbi:uncharacterized protein LOC130668326 [Microplitis mediator]|uniref:uncharacterized protein LOC130668326 n=1 Tax=Microplitis mediator TaxID=375433 RepID=UPI0025528E2B|nr:uncharacterized protein LOC130668326 [Microplitis mediator]
MRGTWYTYQRCTNDWDNLEKCGNTYWGEPKNGVSLVRYTSDSKLSNKTSAFDAEVSMTDDNSLSYNFHLPILGKLVQKHWFLDVDYNNYAIIISCENRGTEHYLRVWIFTRKPTPTINMEEKTRRVFQSCSICSPELVKIDQQHCSYNFNQYRTPYDGYQQSYSYNTDENNFY